MNVIIFTRVSKQTGDYQRQINELEEYSKNRNYNVVEVISEKISGGKKNEERDGIVRLLQVIEKQHIDKILCWELSRIGRNSFEVAKVINTLHQHMISLYIHNYNLETLDNNGEVNPVAKLIIMVLSELSEMERSTIQQRLQSGYYNHLKNGGRVGRIKNSFESPEQIMEKHNDIIKLRRKGISIRNISAITKKSTKTIQKVVHLMTEEP
ncbi:MAG: recombinase family protein [Bacteroidales bacterium]|nr:recombinase family protein [Bacteroidales bacterium]